MTQPVSPPADAQIAGRRKAWLVQHGTAGAAIRHGASAGEHDRIVMGSRGRGEGAHSCSGGSPPRPSSEARAVLVVHAAE
jgi:hypothetical protein